MANLYAAHEQWANRPADERFWTVEELAEKTAHHRASARSAVVPLNQVRVVEAENQLAIAGPAGTPATLTHWSFGQLALRAGAPGGYLRSLPKNLAADCIANGLKNRPDGDEATLLLHQNGSLVCRQFSSDQYARIWNADIAQKLIGLQDQGWTVPPARPAPINQPGARIATEDDVLKFSSHASLGIKVGDAIAPAGLYASDHDMFAFMVNENVRIQDGTDGGLARGFFVTNSEVGAASLKITRFLYRYVCGNHIVWDAKDVKELKIVHKGSNDRHYHYKFARDLAAYAQESTFAEQNRINAAQVMRIAPTKAEVIEVLYSKNLAPRKTLETAYKYAEQEADVRTGGDPRTVWGFVQGLTASSQLSEFADDRVTIDRAAGKLMSMSF